MLLAECKLAIGRRDAAFHQLSQGRHQAEELLGSLADVRDEQLVVAAAALNASIESAARACVDEASCEAARQVLLRAEAAYGRRVAALAKLEQGLKQLAASSSQQLLRSGVPRLNQAIDEALAAEVAVEVTNDAQSRLERALALATLREASGRAQAAWDRLRQHGEVESLENALPPLASAVAALADTGVDSAVVGAAENERRTVRFASPAQTEALVAERLLADVTRALRRRQDAFQALVSAREAAVLHLPPSAACRTANGSVVRRYVDVTALGASPPCMHVLTTAPHPSPQVRGRNGARSGGGRVGQRCRGCQAILRVQASLEGSIDGAHTCKGSGEGGDPSTGTLRRYPIRQATNRTPRWGRRAERRKHTKLRRSARGWSRSQAGPIFEERLAADKERRPRRRRTRGACAH